MARMNTLRSLLALIDAAGGRVETRIRVQKEAFLLATLQAGGFDHSVFSYHHFGPYSRDLSDALQFSVTSELLAEDRDVGASDGSRFSYTLTDKGRRFVSESGQMSDHGRRLVSYMGAQHWRTLELAATVQFLQIRTPLLNQSDAFSEALRLKPDTVPYENNARALLDRLHAEPQLVESPTC